jgi:phosphoenolpyruvate-protein kinase (PTS system EI component)
MILQDSTLERDLAGRLAAGYTAEGSLTRTLDKYVATFQKLSNPFFQERVFDVKDVFRRIMWHLRPGATAAAPGNERLILVAQEASVLDLFSVDLDHLVGVIVEHGGPQSHAAIIARSLGIPMVGKISRPFDQFRAGQFLRIDGSTGQIAVDPSLTDEVSEAPPSIDHVLRDEQVRATVVDRPGFPRIEANVNLLSEAVQVRASGASGVGLYRSEMLFLARRTLPTEEEQVEIYRKLISALGGRPVTIRTFDLRPDKLAHGSAAASSMAQKLDWRLVLESPILQRLFTEQVRAVLRAAASGPVRLLIPLVTRSRLLDFAIATFQAARQELLGEGLEHGHNVPLGVMIEVAAVTPLIGAWSEKVDFFSLGTNDLIASALGISRDDPVGTLADDFLHPGLIRIIADVIASAHRAGRSISVCGEMAADPAGAVVLAALGADALSLAVDRVSPIRELLSRLDAGSLATLGTKLPAVRTGKEIRALIGGIGQLKNAEVPRGGRAQAVVLQG